MKLNYIIIPLLVLFVSFLGGRITSGGMDWYKTIKIPSWTPGGSVIGMVWAFIFILCAISVIFVWNSGNKSDNFYWIIGLFILNALLNIFWSYLFFGIHSMGWAALEAGVLGASVLVLIILIWTLNRLAGSLLIPYVLWVSFATYLTYNIWILNK